MRTTPEKPNPLAGINTDSPHYAGKSERQIWLVILGAFAQLRRKAEPTAGEIGDAFERGLTPGQAWIEIQTQRNRASREGGISK